MYFIDFFLRINELFLYLQDLNLTKIAVYDKNQKNKSLIKKKKSAQHNKSNNTTLLT